jgi:hypothetical protein
MNHPATRSSAPAALLSPPPTSWRSLRMAIALLALAGSAAAQPRTAPVLFREDAAARTAARTSPLAALLQQARPFSLEPATVRAALAAAPPAGSAGGPPVVLALPLPDGSTARFALRQTAVMAPALAARYPEIRTYSGLGLDDATTSVRLSIDPGGLHAQVLMSGHPPVYLDPVSLSDSQHYLSYNVSDRRPAAPLPGCTAPATGASGGRARPSTPAPAEPVTAARNGGGQLHVLRVAVATTDEYTAARGNSVASALAGVVATINRVSGLYERELGLRLELVPNNDLLIAANSPSAPDGFVNNNVYTTSLAENQDLLDRVVGDGSYDLGHVLGTAGGGYATIGSLCTSGVKAMGETGLSTPVGDAFDIQLVAHEMGHQLGATHTFNANSEGSCSDAQREPNSAVEPGSGSTLMAYPGLCGSQNLQGSRDAYFHGVSFGQIQRTLAQQACSQLRPTGNTAPSVSVSGSSKSLPISTPFRLTAYATDPEHDALLYNWDQQNAGSPPKGLADPQLPNMERPLFRSWPASSSPTRYFPRLSTVLANGSDVAEQLPRVAQRLKFSCLVRDLHSGTQGLVSGADQSAELRLDFTDAAGPFVVTAPNTAVSWAVGSTQTVTWNVAGTDANGVDCATVNIRLSTDGGLTYPHLVLAGTPNDGTQLVLVPNVPTATARLLVEAADNYFFDISNASFTITTQPGAPSLSSLSPGSGPEGITVTIAGSNLAGATTVEFEGQSVSFSNATATSLTATVPNLAAPTAAVTVRTAAGLSNSLLFSLQPAITSLAPASGYLGTSQMAGTTLTIAGSGFFGATAVRFNNPSFIVYNLTVDSSGRLITLALPYVVGHTLPATGTVTVLTPHGEITSTATFTVLPTPCLPPRALGITTITSTSARLNFSRSLGDPLAYVMSTSPPSTTNPDFLSGQALSGLTPATTYTVRLVSNCGNGDTSPAATVRFTTAPAGFPNDECAGAILLVTSEPGETCVLTSSPLGAATQSRPPAWCSGTSINQARDVWYRFVATGPTHTVTIGGGSNGALEAFRGSCGGLVSLECVDFTGTGESLTLLGLTPGATYWVRYYSRTTASATVITACVSTPALGAATCVTPPTNLAVNSLSTTSATLDFAPVAGAVSYTVSTIPRTSTRTVSAGPLSFSGLQSGTRYVVSVSTTCADGSVSAPAQLAFTTELPDLVVSTYITIPARAYRNVTITSTGNGALGSNNQNSNLWITGAMRVERGGIYSDNAQIIEGPGSFVLEPGAEMLLSSPEGISQSGPTGAVQLTGRRTFSNNTIFNFLPVISTTGVTGTGLPDTVKTLNFYDYSSPGSTYTLSRNVAVREQLETYGVNLLLGSANLTLLSDLHRTACVMNYEGRILNNGTGRATMQRYVSPTTAYTGPGYRHYSPPVHGATVAGLAVPGRFAPLVNAAYNTLPTPSLPAGQFPTVFRYQESRLTAAFPDFDTGWESPAALSEGLEPGRGYTVNIAPSATVALAGELNSGLLNTGPLTAGSGPNAGWHLLGNPYPSPIVFNEYALRYLPAGLAHAVYVFEPSSQYGGFYHSFVNDIGTDGQQYLMLPAMQGFFMRALQDVPAGFTFSDSLRTYGGIDSALFHRPARRLTRAPRPLLRLTLAGTTAQGTDHAVIYLENGATTNGTDARYDAVKLPNPGAAPQLASQMPGPGNEPLAINGLPDLTARADTRVPLTLRLPAAGAYQLRVAELRDLDPSVPVWLLDHGRGSRVDLRQHPTYGFSAAQAGALDGRFELLLGRAQSSLATAAAAGNAFSVWPNPASSGKPLRVALDAPSPAATATLTTLLGQPVASCRFAGSTAELTTTGLAAGTYLLVLRAAGQPVCTRRVVLE